MYQALRELYQSVATSDLKSDFILNCGNWMLYI